MQEVTDNKQEALCSYKASLIEGKYIYSLTVRELMSDDMREFEYGDQKDLNFNGTVRLQMALNQIKFAYKKGYHTGLSKLFRYGFSHIEHETHLQLSHMDQARVTARNGTTPEQREEIISMWSNHTKLCPDLARPVNITVSLRKEIVSAIKSNAEILSISGKDMAIVILYTALLQCANGEVDEDIIQEGRRFITSFRNVIANKSRLLERCGGI